MNPKYSTIIKCCSFMAAAIVFGAGCASNDARFVNSWHETKRYDGEPTPAPSTPAPSAAPVAYGNYGPSHQIYEVDGEKYIKGSMGFPIGVQGHNGLLLEKHVPREVSIGQPFTVEYRAQNLTGFPIQDVVVEDLLSSGFQYKSSTPAGQNQGNGRVRWDLGNLAANETSVIRLNGIATEEGTITLCGVASYSPVLCEEIIVVRSELKISKDLPEVVVLCDAIPMRITVQNTGSATLRNVVVSDPLPSGLSDASGQSALSFNVGDLAPGETKTLAASLKASQTGQFNNTATATADGGISVDASDSVKVTAPSLSISCEAPENRFQGRPMDVCLTVTNSGDAASANTVITLPIPAGAAFRSATGGGTANASSVQWNLGNLAAGADQTVCATFVSTSIGTVQFNSSVSGDCADPKSANCSTLVAGIPAILLEVIDVEDPIEVGANEVYEITVTNQGSAPGTNISIVCELEDSQGYVSSTGATTGSAAGQTITFAPLPSLAAKAKATWALTVNAKSAGDVRFKVTMNSDQITRVVQETEATNQY